MRGIAIVGACTLLVGCGVEGVFECTEHSQCTARGRGTCVAGVGCAYEDGACESELRFSEHSLRPGECVPLDEGTTTGPLPTSTDPSSSTSEPDESSTMSSESGSTGEPVLDCDGVDCSGHGVCVMLDGAPECACEPTWYRVGLQCLEDPCSTARCVFVDNEQGDDANDGSRDAPWATLDRMRDAGLEPGDAALLRRGRTWTETLRPPSGPDTAELPITVGAYGPIADGPPTVNNVNISGVAHVELRDLRIAPLDAICMLISRSDHVTVRDSELVDCSSRGIRIDDESQYTVIMSNRITGTFGNDAIAVLDIPWKDADPDIDLYVGDHHWIVDNEIAVTMDEWAAAIFTGGVRLSDVKIVGNRAASPGNYGIRTASHGHVWIAGNTVALGGPSACISVDGVDHAVVSGNVAFECDTALRVEGNPTVVVEHNTLVHTATAGSAAALVASTDLVFRDNLVVSAADVFELPMAELADVEVFATNWYADADADCTVRADGMTLPWADWTAANMQDAGSSCAAGPIDGTVPSWSDPSEWSGDFWSALVAEPGWERCAEPAGAFDCDAKRLGTELRPIPGFDDNGGKGWEGPIEVRLRWPMTE